MSAVYLRRNTGQHSIFAFGRIIFIDETIPCHYSMGGKYRTLRYYRTSVNPAVFTDVYLSVGTMYYPCINILHVMEISIHNRTVHRYLRIGSNPDALRAHNLVPLPIWTFSPISITASSRGTSRFTPPAKSTTPQHFTVPSIHNTFEVNDKGCKSTYLNPNLSIPLCIGLLNTILPFRE